MYLFDLSEFQTLSESSSKTAAPWPTITFRKRLLFCHLQSIIGIMRPWVFTIQLSVLLASLWHYISETSALMFKVILSWAFFLSLQLKNLERDAVQRAHFYKGIAIIHSDERGIFWYMVQASSDFVLIITLNDTKTESRENNF